MSILKIATALPLVVGIACSTSGSQSKTDHTGAMWTERKAGSSEPSMNGTGSGGSQDPAFRLAAADPSDRGSSSGSMGSSDSTGSSGSGGSMDSKPSDSPGAAVAPGPSGSSPPSGGAMGSGGSSESMGSAPEKGGSMGQGSAGTTGDMGSTAGSAGRMAEAGHDQWVKGKVSKVSKGEVTITPKTGETRTLKIADQTVVTINGKDAKPSQLKQGQQVRASYSSEGGEDVATKIMVGKMRQGQHPASGSHMKGQGGSSGSPGADTGSSGMGGPSGGSDTK